MKVLYSSWMQELDGRAIEGIGIPSIVLSRNSSPPRPRLHWQVPVSGRVEKSPTTKCCHLPVPSDTFYR